METSVPLERPPKQTLEYALRPYAVSREEIIRRYKPVALMVKQILGVVPRAMSYFEIWPPAFTTYSILVPALMDIPRCDLGRGISPDLRSLVTYVSSRSFGCSYCSAHAAGIGTVFRGPGGSLERNREAMAPEHCALFSAGDRVAIDFANAVASVPAGINEEIRVALASHYSEDHETSIVLATVAMGFLNCCIDTLGMVLERRLLHQSQEYLAASGWEAGERYVEEYDRELIDGESEEFEGLGPLSMARSMAGLIAFDRGALRGIEKRPVKLEAQLREELGFVPSYIQRVDRVPVKRLWAHMLIERLNSEEGFVPSRIRYTMCFIAAKRFECRLLAAHFAFLAVRAGSSPKDLRAALISSRPEDAEGAAYALARASSVAPVVVPQLLIQGLMSHYSPEGIMDLVVGVSIVAMLQRYTSVYPVDRYEEPIAAFVAEHGKTLGLVASPGRAGENWDLAAQRVRSAVAG